MRLQSFAGLALAVAAACAGPTPTAVAPPLATPAATLAPTLTAAAPATRAAPTATSTPAVATDAPTAQASATPQPDLAPPHVETKVESQTGTAYGLSFSPDGQFLAVASGAELTLLTADLQATVTVFQPEGIPLLSAAWSPDGRQLATVAGLRDRIIHLWNWDPEARTITPAQDLNGGTDQYGVSWSPDGQRLASLAADRRSFIQLWDTATWAKGQLFQLPYAAPRRAFDWSPDSTRLYDAGEKDGQMLVFSVDVRDGSVTEYPHLPVDERLQALAVSPDERVIALADDAGQLRLLDLVTAEVRWVLAGPAEIDDLAWSPAGDRLAVLTYHATVQVWDLSAAGAPETTTLMRGDAARTGVYPVAPVAVEPQVLWDQRVGSYLLSAPLYADGTLYVGDYQGRLFALEPETGETRWQAPLGQFYETALAVAGDFVIVGGMEGSVFGLERETGAERWTFQADGRLAAPLVVGQQIFAATTSTLYALDLATGQLRWQAELATNDVYAAAPAYAAGVVYAASDQVLAAIDAQTGQDRWRMTTEAPVFGGVALADGLVYLGLGDGTLRAYSQATGEPAWSFAARDPGPISFWSAPASAGGLVYAGNRDGYLYAVDAATGAKRWEFDTAGGFVSGPVVAGGLVYMTDGNHEVRRRPLHVFALDAATGALRWSFTQTSTLLNTVAISDGTLYLALNGQVLALR
jgi:outer membrane protein assembly factor BamB